MAAANERIAGVYAGLDRELAARAHLCNAFTVADIGYFLTTNFAAGLGAPPEESHRHVAAWLERVGGRPSVRREQEGMRASLASLAA